MNNNLVNGYAGMYNNGYNSSNMYGNMYYDYMYPTTGGYNRTAYAYQQIPQQQNNYSSQRNVLYGRFVNSIEEITPNEVPMDGSISIFPRNDYAEIYVKTWDTNGTIKTFTFVPQQTIEEKELNINDIVLERLDNIEKLLSKKTTSLKKDTLKREVIVDDEQ